MRRLTLAQKILHAVDGFTHACRTQRHMRMHVVVVLGLTFLALWLDFAPIEIALIFGAWALVLLAEMMNTAIEAVLDLASASYSPIIKHAKDIAAGAVLIAWLNAVFVVSILFLQGDRLRQLIKSGVLGTGATGATDTRMYVIYTILGVVIILLISFLLKLQARHGSFLSGGLVSVHSAVGFFLAAVVFYSAVTNPNLAKILALLLAITIAQSRVDAGVHSLHEVLFGSLLGFVLGVLMLRLFLA